jgi:hypothetical protein
MQRRSRAAVNCRLVVILICVFLLEFFTWRERAPCACKLSHPVTPLLHPAT